MLETELWGPLLSTFWSCVNGKTDEYKKKMVLNCVLHRFIIALQQDSIIPIKPH